jgi:isoleucyl-tRNA synthetase
MFKPVASRVNLPAMEEEILKFWRDEDIFRRSVEGRKEGRRFVFYEGPPTANGNPGIHHVLSRVFKDIILRYRAMKGDYVPRIAGWDTHGLPVELEVEKQLGISSKSQIEEYGIAAFNEKCRESVFTYLKEWDQMTERIAYWLDLKNAYVTMTNDYIETGWWAIKQMWDKGLVYQGYRVTPHCPRCGTSLSSHEVALGYQDDTEDPSVFVKFKVNTLSLIGSDLYESLAKMFIDAAKPAYLLAWTTTPWTLPANTALAVSPEDRYAVVETEDSYLILAEARLAAVGLEDMRRIGGFSGRDLAGIKYEPLFNPHKFNVTRRRFPGGDDGEAGGELPVQTANLSLKYRVVVTDFVSMEDGTGIVHMAPAYGEVDYQAGVEQGLDFVHVIDLAGKVIGEYPFAGKFAKDADPEIIADLEARGLMFLAGTIKHTYPFCWRCGTPLLYYAKESWYIRTTEVKEKLISGNEEINWYPEHIKHGRFGDWLENNVDWAISRERYWGTPLPIWRCESCNRGDCVGGVADLKSRPGLQGITEPLDMHRPHVDEITYKCPDCGGTMRRVKDVIDCWFDSGVMPIAQWHYPFENETLLDDGRFPADYISEAVDQTRGWFYSLHAISTLLFGRGCYRNVICLGHILDAKGDKMSKTSGNVVQSDTVIDKHGADALRWYFLTGSPPGNVRRFDERQVQEINRRFLMTLWNVYSFFILYANIDDYQPEEAASEAALSELDQWIISEMNLMVAEVDEGLDGYNPTDAGRKIERFVDNLSNWYVRLSRRRFWKSESDADKMAAYRTLYDCLVTVTKVMAPFAPFIAEEIYRNLATGMADAPESVHLCDFPVADKTVIDEKLNQNTRLAMKVSSLGRAARSKAGIKVRQPLHKMLVMVGKNEREGLETVAPQVMDELNVKALEVIDSVAGLAEGAYIISEEAAYAVACPCKEDIPDDLLKEGMAREIAHRVQTLRKNAGYDIADHIRLWCRGDDYVNKIIADFRDYLCQETLAVALSVDTPPEDAFGEEVKLSGHEVALSVVKA